MAKDVGYIKDFLERKLKYISLKGFLIRIPVYFTIVFLVLFLLESSGLVLDIVLNEGDNISLFLRFKTLLVRVLFYTLPAIFVWAVIGFSKKELKIINYVLEMQIFIIIITIFTFIINLGSLPNEDNDIFNFGTNIVVIVLAFIIQYVEFISKNKQNQKESS